MPSAFVYIIIPNTNGHVHTIECLETVLKQTYQRFKVVVVDNSKDDTSYQQIISWCNGGAEHIETKFPQYVTPLVAKPVKYKFFKEDEADLAVNQHAAEQLILIKANNNDGFSAANNIGLKYALKQTDFDWAWLLNNDTVIPPDCLEQFANYQPATDKVGIVATKLFYYTSPQTLQGIGGKYNKWLGTTRHVADNEQDTGQYDHIKLSNYVDYIIAASMFVSKPFIEDVGLMCEDYFFYFEELDWITRGKRKGWQIDLAPKCKVYHKDGSTIPNQTKAKTLLSDIAAIRNRLYFTRKFHPWYAPVTYSGLLAVILLRIRRKQFKRLKYILSAVIFNKNPKEYLKIQGV